MFLLKNGGITFTVLLTLNIIVNFSNVNGFRDKNGNKIEDKVDERAKRGETSNVMVECQPPKSNNLAQNPLQSLLKMTKGMDFSNKTDLEQEKVLTDIVGSLITSVNHALNTVLKVLNMNDATYQTLYLSNKVFIFHISPDLLPKLASLEIVTRISLDRLVTIISRASPVPTPPTGNNSYNIGLIDARCNTITCLGENVKVGIIGTGVNGLHEQLKDNFAGAPFGWWNATKGGPDGTIPYDSIGYGTAVAGLAVGKTFGVAPKSTWMACSFCSYDASTCSQGALEICFHFMTCPWSSLDNSITNCTARPDIIVSRFYKYVGGQLFDPALNIFKNIISVWNQLGILSYFGIGDNGPDCNSGYIPGIYDNAFSVGAVDENATIIDTSSRGPVIQNTSLSMDRISEGTCPQFLGDSEKCIGYVEGENICTLIKPEIVAPGYQLTSAWWNATSAVSIVNGTEYAAAQVAGVASLMKCANSGLKWNSKLAFDIIRETAEKNLDLKGTRPPSQTTQEFPTGSNVLCNLILSGICNSLPNNVYGNGLINACRAVTKVKGMKPWMSG